MPTSEIAERTRHASTSRTNQFFFFFPPKNSFVPLYFYFSTVSAGAYITVVVVRIITDTAARTIDRANIVNRYDARDIGAIHVAEQTRRNFSVLMRLRR